MRPLRFRQIEALRALVEGGTVTRAAELLNVSQPAVSKLLAHLEADCGVPIFRRIKKRLVLTVAGSRLYDEVDRIFLGMHQLDAAMAAIRRDEQGRLIIGASPVLSHFVVPRIVIKLMKAHPSITISVVAMASQVIADRLKLGEVDIGLMFPNYHVRNTEFDAARIIPSALVCILPQGHKLAAKNTIAPEDLAGLPFISPPPTSQLGRQIGSAFSSRGIKPNLVVETTTASSIGEFVAAGLGISLVHPLFASQIHNSIVVRRFEPKLMTEILICRSRERRNQNLVDEFVRIAKGVGNEIAGELASPSRGSVR